jgi:beta-mannosidase
MFGVPHGIAVILTGLGCLASVITASGKEAGGNVDPIVVAFEPVEVRHVRLTMFGINAGNAPCLDELEVFAPGAVENLASAEHHATATASSCLADDPRHKVAHLNDGSYGNEHSWVAAESGTQWAQIELPAPTKIDALAFSRDRTGQFTDREPTSFRVEVSLDGRRWQEVAFFPGPGGAARGPITPERRPTASAAACRAEQVPSHALPRVRRMLADPAPQYTATGESLCLNGDDWWMRQIPSPPHWDEWPPEPQLLASVLEELPHDGLGEGTRWIRATVPGSVQSALLENGLAPWPWYYAENFRALERATVGKQSWFIKRFSVPAGWQGRRVRLRLGAVDYRAQYYINGRWAGQSEGHFAPVMLDIESHLRFGEQNVLAVQLDAFPYDSPLDAIQGRALAAQLPRSQILANWRGADFAPTCCPLGITDDVHLLASGPAAIDDIWVRCILAAGNHAAEVGVETSIDSRQGIAARLCLAVHPQKSPEPVQRVEQEARLKPGENVLRTALQVTEPRLWWPNEHGPQNLYLAEVVLFGEDGTVLDRADRTFGIRRLEKVFNEGHDLSPYPWTFVINGRKIYAKGAGWVPMNPLHLMDRARYVRILEQAQAAHFTMVRWWGGGVPERPAFYELCDRLGLMVYQDFFLANNEHDNPRFLERLDAQATAFVKRLRNHPSLVQWTGGNELFNGTVNYHAQAKLWEIVGRHDPDRPFCPSSPAIGVKHAITDYYYRPDTDYRMANQFGADPELGMKIRSDEYPDWQIIGQPHNEVYQEWIARLRRAGFEPSNAEHRANAFDIQLTAEGGAATVANEATLRKIIPADDLARLDAAQLSPSWLYHNVRPGSYDWLQHDTTVAMFGPISDLKTYVRAAQTSRAQILKYGLEEMRRRKFCTSGTLMWQLNETWPNAAGNAIIDFFGDPRITFQHVMQAYEPAHASLRFDRIRWKGGERFQAELWIASDLPEALHQCEASWQVADVRGRTLAAGNVTIAVPANTAIKAADLAWDIPADYDDVFLVSCRAIDRTNGKLLAKNVYYHTAHDSTPQAFAPLLPLLSRD